MRSRWMNSATPEAAGVSKYKVDRIMESARDSFDVTAGPAGMRDERPLPVAMDRLAALVATARDPSVDERCIANPVWVVPVSIDLERGAVEPSAREGVAFAPGGLKVVFHFPISMSSTAGTRACLRALDDHGYSTDPVIELTPDPGWEVDAGVNAARYSVTNTHPIVMHPGDWDARLHQRVPGARSFVVYLEQPADVHGNVLNDVGRAFVQAPAATTR
jgi:hypothetical protein